MTSRRSFLFRFPTIKKKILSKRSVNPSDIASEVKIGVKRLLLPIAIPPDYQHKECKRYGGKGCENPKRRGVDAKVYGKKTKKQRKCQ